LLEETTGAFDNSRLTGNHRSRIRRATHCATHHFIYPGDSPNMIA